MLRLCYTVRTRTIGVELGVLQQLQLKDRAVSYVTTFIKD
jgi:hypothetical protein